MDQIVSSLLPFLAILNPFALCLYLVGLMDDLERRAFMVVLLRASLIALVVFWLFALAGEPLLRGFLGVRPEALRIFGGVVFFVVAYNYVIKGYKAAELLRGSLEEVVPAIALPFMIGAGTITQSIIVGKTHGPYVSALVLLVGILISFIVVISFKYVRDRLKRSQEKVFERYVNILSRVNGLLVGAVSTEMIISGIKTLCLQQ